jgi:hypothetical protein
MNIQYCHVRKFIACPFDYEVELSAKGGQTVAMQELELWFVESLKAGDFFTKLAGQAKCSDKENYNKKTGRELAKSRMKATVFTVQENNDYGGLRELILKDDKNNSYVLQKRPDHNKVHFIGYLNA